MQVSENSIFTCFVRFLGMGNKVHFESVRLYMAIVIEIEIALNNLFFQFLKNKNSLPYLKFGLSIMQKLVFST